MFVQKLFAFVSFADDMRPMVAPTGSYYPYGNDIFVVGTGVHDCPYYQHMNITKNDRNRSGNG